MFKTTKFTMEVKDKDFKKFFDLLLTRKGTNLIQYRYEYYDYGDHYKYILFVHDLQYRVFRNKLDNVRRLGIIEKFTEEAP